MDGEPPRKSPSQDCPACGSPMAAMLVAAGYPSPAFACKACGITEFGPREYVKPVKPVITQPRAHDPDSRNRTPSQPGTSFGDMCGYPGLAIRLPSYPQFLQPDRVTYSHPESNSSSYKADTAQQLGAQACCRSGHIRSYPPFCGGW
jgi:hypothetical protein